MLRMSRHQMSLRAVQGVSWCASPGTTCVATTSAGRGRGHAQALIAAVVDDLERRGFSAIEAYPDLTLGPDEASAASPAFWHRCGFERVIEDERFPVMRRELS